MCCTNAGLTFLRQVPGDRTAADLPGARRQSGDVGARLRGRHPTVTLVDSALVLSSGPTSTVRLPVAVVHPAASDQYWSWRSGTCMVTVRVSPGAR